MLEILDTAGQEEFKAQRDEWIRESDGFVIVYSITSRASFENVQEFYDTIRTVKEGENVSVVLAGNKVDLQDERAVSTEDGQELANRLGARFRETSAKTRLNIQEVFVDAVQMIMQDQGNTNITPAAPAKKQRGGCILL